MNVDLTTDVDYTDPSLSYLSTSPVSGIKVMGSRLLPTLSDNRHLRPADDAGLIVFATLCILVFTLTVDTLLRVDRPADQADMTQAGGSRAMVAADRGRHTA